MKTLFEWKEEMSMGNKQIDEQHKKIIDAANALHSAMILGKGQEIIKETINALTEYITKHFEYEEKYLKEYKYPNYSSHIDEHKKFLEEYYELMNKLEEKETTSNLIIKTSNLINNWIRNHLKGEFEEFHDFWMNVAKENK